MITVCFTVNNRPKYLRETLASWSAVRGVDEVAFVFRCEPGCDEARDLCSQFVGEHGGIVTVNPHRYGVLGNPWAALETGFSFSDDDSEFCVLAEEDLVVSPDVLEFFTWCQRYQVDPQVLGVSTYQHHEQPGDLPGVRVADWSRDDQWHFWVWGTWRDRWRALLCDDWDFTYRENGGGPSQAGWDWRIRNLLILGQGYKMIVPSMARSQHIGKFGGAHCTADQFDALLSPSFAGLAVLVQDYTEEPEPAPALPGRATPHLAQPNRVQ